MQRKWLVQSNLQRMVGRCCGSMSMTCPMISLAFEDESEAEQCIKRLQSHKGVKRVFIINNQGQTIRSSLNDPEEERRYAVLISELTKKTRSMVRELDPENALTFLRVRTLKEEIMIAPERTEGKYTLIVVQDPKDDEDIKSQDLMP